MGCGVWWGAAGCVCGVGVWVWLGVGAWVCVGVWVLVCVSVWVCEGECVGVCGTQTLKEVLNSHKVRASARHEFSCC